MTANQEMQRTRRGGRGEKEQQRVETVAARLLKDWTPG